MRQVLLALSSVMMTLALLGVALINLLAWQPAVAAGAFFSAAFFTVLNIFAMRFHYRRRFSDSAVVNESGALVLHFSRAAMRLLRAFVRTFLAGLACWGVAALNAGWFVLAAALLVPALGGIVAVLRGRRADLAPDRLVLAPDGVSFIRAGARLAARWDDLLDVQTLQWSDDQGFVFSRRLRLVTRQLSGDPTPRPLVARLLRLRAEPRIEIASEMTDVDPVRLYDLLTFYRTHPSARAELGTRSALVRFRHGPLNG